MSLADWLAPHWEKAALLGIAQRSIRITRSKNQGKIQKRKPLRTHLHMSRELIGNLFFDIARGSRAGKIIE
ncbi:MAG: hypothetical protein ABIP71_04300 [Verrucomicrobiota bacterium]